NSHYTAKLTAITPAPAGGKFAPATEYTYEFTLDAQTGYNFATAAPTIFVSDPAAAQTTIIKSQNADKTQIVATYTFLATETNIISDVAFIAGLKQPVSGENAPSSANFAEEDAHYTAALAIQQSSNGTSWAAMSGSGFVTDMFYKYIFTATAKTDYLFAGGTVTAPVIDLVPAVISGNGTGVLTLTYTFEKTGGLVSISAGTITVTEPAAGQPAQALDTGNLAGASDNFTAQLHSYGGALNGANYSAAAAYTFVFALTPKTNYKFTDSAAINITVNGNAGVYAYISDTSATVSYAWPSLAYPEDNRAINLAYNRGAYATGSATNTNSAYANAFDGDITTNWQATNTGTQWLEVDLGNNYDIGTVRIYFNAANGTNIFNDGAVWVATGDTLPVIDSTDWTNVGSFECANNATSVTVTVPNGTSARYVRVMALTASTATTNYWVRVTELEVYSAGPATTAAIGAKAVTGITAPVALETPPAIGTAYTTNDVNFTAELTGIEGALGTDNNFDYDTAYAYDIKLIANPGYHFTTVLPSINGTNVIAADLISNNGYEMVVRRTFAKTGLAPVVGGHTVSFANGGIVNDSANSGLTATATTAQSEFNAGQTVTVTVKVTGTSKRAAIYEAKLSNDKGLTINFVPGIIGTSSNVPKRNIGGIGAFSATTQENLLTTDINGIVSGSAEATGEVIGSAFAGTPGITTQPAEDWTFNMAFTMPDDNVTLTLTNTFMTDIVPAIVAKAVDPVNGIPAYGTDTAPYKSAFADNVVKGSKWSNDTGLHTPLKAFNGQYNHHTNGWDNRWELTTDPANQWVALNLGNNYDISDIVLRFRNSGIGERQYRIYVSNDDSVWDELSATPTTSATSGTPLSYAAVDANSKWTKGWEVNSTDPITNNNYCYHPLFLGADNTILRDLGSNGANGIGPYRGVDSYWTNNGSGHIVTTPNSPIEAKYVLLVIQSGVQASATINNFEIYGTPVQP
ncbi:MAG: discoidin domain-containing protein, partial [Treponema sp.]|nr:discoidin domain-containing protein [Treponema sp.]